MMITVSRLYPDGRLALAVVDELKAAGLPEDDIGIIAPSRDRSLRMENADTENSGDRIDRDRNGRDDRHQAAVRAAALGGAAGLLAGLGAFVLPGVGAVVAAGWLASALAGAVGSVAGGIVGALVESGVSENDAAQFAEGVKRGGTLVTVRMMEQDRTYYESIMAMTQVPRVLGNYDPAGMPIQLRDSIKP